MARPCPEDTASTSRPLPTDVYERQAVSRPRGVRSCALLHLHRLWLLHCARRMLSARDRARMIRIERCAMTRRTAMQRPVMCGLILATGLVLAGAGPAAAQRRCKEAG